MLVTVRPVCEVFRGLIMTAVRTRGQDAVGEHFGVGAKVDDPRHHP